MLALPADDQVAWLRSLGLGEPGMADELALELSDGIRLLDQFLEAGWLSRETAVPAIRIDELLTSRSSPEQAAFWTVESLRTSSEWAEIRELARQALFTV